MVKCREHNRCIIDVNLMLLKASFLGCATIDYLILVASTATGDESHLEENHRSGCESLRNIPNV